MAPWNWALSLLAGFTARDKKERGETFFKNYFQKKKSPSEEPAAKRQRLEDARVPAVSRESSEETVSSDDTGVGLRKEAKRQQPFCEPSTSKQEDEESLEKTSKSEPSGCKSVHRCQWDECAHVAANINHLYDHVMETHLQDVASQTEGHEEELECLWGDCSMSIVRGDWGKKIKWLEEHYRTRHAKNAQTVRCVIESCSFRCSTLCKLDEHVRWKHMQNEEVEEPVVEELKKTPQEEPQIREKPAQLIQDKYLFDWYYEDILVQRNKRALDLNNECEWILKKQSGVGAKRRKTRASLIGEWVPISPKPESQPPRRDDCEKTKTNFSLTLEDLFPGWGYKSISSHPDEDSDSSDDDFPVLERVSPCPTNIFLEDESPPPLLPQTSSDDEYDSDSSSPPSLEPHYSDLESECLKCLESILDRLI